MLECVGQGRAEPQLHVFSPQLAPTVFQSLAFSYSWRDLMLTSANFPAVTFRLHQTASLWNLPLAILCAQKCVHSSVLCPKEDRLKEEAHTGTGNKVWAFRQGLLRSWIPRTWPRRGTCGLWLVMTWL